MPAQAKRSSVLWSREYETRELNGNSDAVDVHHFPVKAEAIRKAQELVKHGAVAAVVEYHVSRYPYRGTPDRYTEIVAYGDRSVIESFGWEGRVE